MIRKYKPDIILCNAIDDRHIDHPRGAKLVIDSCFLSGLKKIVTKYNNNQSVYVLGEVSKPSIIQLGLEQVSLTNAIGQSRGLNSITSKSTDVFLVRSKDESEPKIYKVNLKNPSGFILANQFYVKPQDVIFVGASSITRWNRVISQLFPFTSFLNQIDQIDSRD